jgi:hypothetical protein
MRSARILPANNLKNCQVTCDHSLVANLDRAIRSLREALDRALPSKIIRISLRLYRNRSARRFRSDFMASIGCQRFLYSFPNVALSPPVWGSPYCSYIPVNPTNLPVIQGLFANANVVFDPTRYRAVLSCADQSLWVAQRPIDKSMPTIPSSGLPTASWGIPFSLLALGVPTYVAGNMPSSGS